MLTKKLSFDFNGFRKEKVRIELDDNVNYGTVTATMSSKVKDQRQQPKFFRCISLSRLFCPHQPKEKRYSRQTEVSFCLDENENKTNLITSDLSLFYIDVDKLVQLPSGLDSNEWLATNTVAFFEGVSVVFGAVSDYCCPLSCPSLTGPSASNQSWIDEKGKKFKYSAVQYIDLAMASLQRLIQLETNFPTKFGNSFPRTFEATIKHIMTILGRILCHIYHAHWRHVSATTLSRHLSLLTRHFCSFVSHHKLLPCDEYDLLIDLHQKAMTTAVTMPTAVTTACAETTATSSSNQTVTAGSVSKMECASDKHCQFFIDNGTENKPSSSSDDIQLVVDDRQLIVIDDGLLVSAGLASSSSATVRPTMRDEAKPLMHLELSLCNDAFQY